MSMPEEPAKKKSRAGRPWGPLLFVVLVLGASLYAFGGLGNLFNAPKPGDSAQCRAAPALAARLKPLAKGEIAALQVIERPTPLVPLTFLNAKGETVTLASFRGKTILLNLWATWCAPCRQEMPALDALQGAAGGADFEVVAVNIDTRNFDKPKAFLDEVNVKRLAYYSDPAAKVFQDLKAAGKAFGMPTTLLIDANGCELANLAGPAEWSGPEALALVREAIRR